MSSSEQIQQQIQAGEYMIHVYIKSAKKLNISGEQADVIARITIPQLNTMKQMEESKVCKKNQTTDWNDHAFIQCQGANQEELQDSMIELQIMEKGNKSSGKNQMIGLYEFSLEQIYQKKNHALLHQWVALTDNSEESVQKHAITGYVQVSIQVTGKKDDPIKLEDYNSKDLKTSLNNVLVPSHVQAKYHQITLRIFSAQDIIMNPSGGILSKKNTKIDCYVKLDVAGQVMVTNAIQIKDGIIDWKQEMLIPVRIPYLIDTINLELWDQGQKNAIGWSNDDIILGSFPLKVQDILDNKYNELTWINIYGAPTEQKNDETELMNKNPEFATKWKGRVMIQVDSKETDKPCQKTRIMQDNEEGKDHKEQKIVKMNTGIEKSLMQSALDMHQDFEYEVCLDLGLGISLPEQKRYKIWMGITDQYIKSEQARVIPPDTKGGYNVFSYRLTEKIKLPYESIKKIGYIFLYLVDDKDNTISYAKFDAREFEAEKQDWKYHQFIVDPSISAIKDKRNGGIIQFRCFMRPVGLDDKPIKESMIYTKKQLPKLPSAFKVRAFIYQCRDLEPVDDNGLADPFVRIWNKQDKLQTSTKIKSLNPIFYEVKDMMVEVFADLPKDLESEEYQSKVIEACPPILFDIMDIDAKLLKSTEEFISRSVIHLKSASCKFVRKNKCYETQSLIEKRIQSENDQNEMVFSGNQLLTKNSQINENAPPPPKWHSCRTFPSAPPQGQILVSFEICESDEKLDDPKDYDISKYISFRPVTFEIHCLGLRDLKSAGILPVKKATIMFNFQNLIQQNRDGLKIENVQTDPGQSGPNPTINTMLKYELPLPIDKLLCPDLFCVVNDNIFQGQFQPVVGNFKIDLSQLLYQKNEKYNSDIKALQQLYEQLESGIFVANYDGSSSMKSDLSAESREQPKPILSQIGLGIGGAFGKVGSAASKLGSGIGGAVQMIKLPKKDTETDKTLESEYNEQLIEMYDKDATQQSQNINETLENDIERATNIRSESVLKQMPKSEYDETKFSEEQKNLINEYTSIIKKNYNVNSLKSSQDDKSIEIMLKGKIAADKDVQKVIEHVEKRLKDMNSIKVDTIAKFKKQFIHRSMTKFQKQDPTRAGLNFFYAQYEYDERIKCNVENHIPPEDNFMAIGKDENHLSKTKHYRKIYHKQLENVKEVMGTEEETPFQTFDIKIGQSQKSSGGGMASFFSMNSNDQVITKTEQKHMGYFKGIVNVYIEENRKSLDEDKNEICQKIVNKVNEICKEKNVLAEGEELLTQEKLFNRDFRNIWRQKMIDTDMANLQIIKRLLAIQAEEYTKLQLSMKSKCKISLYLLDGLNLASRDLMKNSDPYVIVKIGHQSWNNRNRYIADCKDPQFFEKVQMLCCFPGDCRLKIEVMDYDTLFGDDLIGSTQIDIEDRFYSNQWQGTRNKPIETRSLMHQAYATDQGKLRLWLDINSQDQAGEDWDITPPPVEEYEVRVCVFGGKGVPIMDKHEGTSDVFFRAHMDEYENDKFETDTHYRNMDGFPSFNYRLKIPFKHQKKASTTLTLECFDRDFVVFTESIGKVSIDLEQAFRDCKNTGKSQTISKKYYNEFLKQFKPWKELKLQFSDKLKFWVDLFAPDEKNKNKPKKMCSVELQIQILSKESALKEPAGKGREDPNQDPHLPAPEGRIEFSMNPRKMLSQLIGPNILAMWRNYCVCFVLLALLVYFLPQILQTVLTVLILKE